jgi:hypothetical protein
MVLLAAMVTALSSTTAAAQDTLWTRLYGGTASEFAHAVCPTDDGGYLFCGGTESFGAGDWDVYLLRTDAGGDTLWTRTYGGVGRDLGAGLAPVPDGGFIVAGETASYGAGDYDIYLLRIDADGDTLWTRTYGGAEHERGSGIIRTTDGRYAVCGRTSSFGAGDHDAYLVLVDVDGDTLATRTYGGAQTDIAFSIRQTSEGGFVLGGVTSSRGAGSYDHWLVKTDAQGDLEWSRPYGGVEMEWCHYAIQAADDGYVLVGSTYSWGSGADDVYLVRTDASGDTTWTRVYGGADSDGGNFVEQTPDGGFLVAGFSGDFSAGWGDAYVLRLDAWGDTLWTRKYSRGAWYDRQVAGETRTTSDGDYVIAASSERNGTGLDDVWLLKIADNLPLAVEGGPDPPPSPGGALLRRIHPNPFGGATRITFSLARAGPVTLAVFDLLGRRVETLVDGWTDQGDHSVPWDGAGQSPGVYLVRLAAQGEVSVGRMALVR